MKMLRSSRQTLENLHEQKEDWNNVLDEGRSMHMIKLQLKKVRLQVWKSTLINFMIFA
jgi:hypothetical protein